MRREQDIAFDLQPILRGEMIELRPLQPDDFAALFAAASDPLIWQQHPEPDRYREEVFLRYFRGALDSQGAFAIVDRASGAMIGSSRYCNLKPNESEVEVGWTFLRRDFWGGAHNRELKSLMLDHAFRFVDRVVFVVGEHNFRSQRALAKIGAKLMTTRDTPQPDGSLRKDVVFAIER